MIFRGRSRPLCVCLCTRRVRCRDSPWDPMGPCAHGDGRPEEEEEVRSVFYSLVTSLVYRLKRWSGGQRSCLTVEETLRKEWR